MKLFFPEINLQAIAASYGFFTHATKTRDALARAGVLVYSKAEADFALQVGPSYMFKPLDGIRNILFSAFEGSMLSNADAAPLKSADLVFVPCEHNKNLLTRYHNRVTVVPLGVDPIAFPFVERRAPEAGEAFRFLFLGNMHPCKGAPTLLKTFELWQEQGKIPPNVELLIKTSTEATRNGKPFQGLDIQTVQDGKFRPSNTQALPGIIVDNRNLPASDIRDIYKSAHCYVQPTFGEGWGLSLSEAMATGLPSIYTGWSAPLDYADERSGYPLKAGKDGFKLSSMPWRPQDTGAKVSTQALIKAMDHVYRNYGEALDKGKAASDRMHSEFTWDLTAQKIIAACENHS